MNMAERWLARKTPPKSWADQAARDAVGACESDNWGPAPDIVVGRRSGKSLDLERALMRELIDSLPAEPIELRAERVRAKIKASKTLIGLGAAPGLQVVGK